MTWSDLVEAWRQDMQTNTGLAAKTISEYSKDGLTWAKWADGQGIYEAEGVTTGDVREYRDAREKGAGRAPRTANRRLISLALLLDFAGRKVDNPARKVPNLEDADKDDGRALSRNEWNALRRAAEQAGGLAEALVGLLRYAGPRIGEIVPETASDGRSPFVLGDLELSARSGQMVLRQGKRKKRRTVPMVLEAREPLRAYLDGERADRVDAWAARRRWTEEQRLWWSGPDAPVFLSERGPLTVRGARHVVAALGERARLSEPVGPHDLRATFITALLDPGKYGLVREPVPITVAARLAGHRSVTTTAIYGKPDQDDLMRWMVGT